MPVDSRLDALNEVRRIAGPKSTGVKLLQQIHQTTSVHSFTPGKVASLFQTTTSDAVETLLLLSTPRLGVMKLRVFALDSEGGHVEFPTEVLRHYFESSILLDPRTGEKYHSPDEVMIQFVTTPEWINLERS